MTWSLPATAATATSLSRAGTGAFMVQLPCGVPCACAADAHVPTAAQTQASVTTLRARSLIVSLPLVPYSGRSRFDAIRRKPFCRKLVLRSAVGTALSPAEPSAQPPASHPAFQLAQRDMPDYQHARIAIVKTRDRHKILAAIALEHIGVVDRDLLQGLEAVGRKTGRDHGELLDATFGERLDAVDGCGLEPSGPAKARLEGEHQFLLVHPELLPQQPRRHHALIEIRIT